MAKAFSIGEIVIVRDADNPGDPRNGDEAEVVDLPRPTDFFSSASGKMVHAGKYVILYCGAYYQTWPKHLHKRRRPPPREQTSTWDDVIVWRPKETSHV